MSGNEGCDLSAFDSLSQKQSVPIQQLHQPSTSTSGTMTTPAMLYNRSRLDDDDSDDDCDRTAPPRQRRKITKTKSIRHVYRREQFKLSRADKKNVSVDSSISQSDDGDDDEEDEGSSSSFLTYCLKNHRQSPSPKQLF